ncbi:hypothetical protein VTK73DRAFT_953 [Phialemonium thermophilum]|uniref:Gfd2/YDR514C-like C-terminal domain-containing protein n=1 Tax=Phialemonium thermophilum TaxID=223376 RepID=A0ABR3XCC5_9PEZI
MITEVGIATLDTRDLQVTPAGESGEGWFPLIRAHHLRIKENSWARNSKHVQGCPANFNFGTSTFVRSQNVGRDISKILDHTMSLGSVGDHQSHKTRRPVVLVFHDPSQDLKYLKTLGFNVYNSMDIVETVDTRTMHQYLNRAKNPAGLGTVLSSLGLSYRYLHNAGNDACYTLRAMIGLAIKKQRSGHRKEKTEDVSAINNESASDSEGWSSNGEDVGGEAVRPTDPGLN